MYGKEHIKLQKQFDSERLAAKTVENIVTDEIQDTQKGFIESRDMFFLTTIDHLGQPTVSYKGGSPGLLTVIDESTLIFPLYDGNGMFLTAGNMVGNEKIGLLLIDFETPFRLRIQGRAKSVNTPEYFEKFHEAQLIFEVAIDKVWVNCNRYIHPHKKLETSKYVPKIGVKTPFPMWKRIEGVSETLPYDGPEKAKAEGPSISPEEWMGKIQSKDA